MFCVWVLTEQHFYDFFIFKLFIVKYFLLCTRGCTSRVECKFKIFSLQLNEIFLFQNLSLFCENVQIWSKKKQVKRTSSNENLWANVFFSWKFTMKWNFYCLNLEHLKICSVMGQLTEEVDSELQLTDQYSNSLISDPRDTLNQDHLRLSNRNDLV